MFTNPCGQNPPVVRLQTGPGDSSSLEAQQDGNGRQHRENSGYDDEILGDQRQAGGGGGGRRHVGSKHADERFERKQASKRPAIVAWRNQQM